MIHSFRILLFICALSSLQAKQQPYGNLRVETVKRVHDGDTFIVDIAHVHPIIGKEISVRINGIDSPEITDKRENIRALAIKARDYVTQRLQKAKIIELNNVRRDKYFRILADVRLDGIDLASELLSENLAKPYLGKTKPIW